MLCKIRQLLNNHPWQDKIQYFDTIDSTNTFAKTLAAQGVAHGTVILAGSQTGGRGRLGRSFSSPKDMGVYLSVILRPGCKPTQLMHLTCATAVAGCTAIRNACDIAPQIKWTNDLVLGKRKLGGILTELSVNPKTGLVDWVIVGIGINCCQSEADFPPEIRDIACSLSLAPQDRAVVAAELIRQLYGMDCNLLTRKAQIMAIYRQNCITLGKPVSILRGEQVQHGIALDLDDDGALTVKMDDGNTETFSSGEVSIRGMYGYL